MSTTLKPSYGSHTAITITSLNSLATGGAAGSLVVDNTSNLYEDANVSVTIAAPASGTLASGTVTVYAYGPVDGTPHYTDGATGTDATQTLTSPTNLRVIGAGNVVANSTTYRIGPFSVCAGLGTRYLPSRWGIVVVQNTGGTLPGSGHTADFEPVNGQGV